MFLIVIIATTFALMSSVLVCAFRRVKSKTSDNTEPEKVPQISDESGSNYVYVVPNKPDPKKTFELPETRTKVENSSLNYVQVDLKPRSLATLSKTTLDEDKSYFNAKEFVAVVS